MELEWTYGMGYEAAASTDLSLLTDNSVNTNVVLDMYLDSDETMSQDPAGATFEVMIWFATIGPATQPIGLDQGSVATRVLSGETL